MPYDLKAHRERLRAEGICVRCHKHRAELDRALCAVCRVERRVNLRRLRARWRTDRERCVVCGTIKPPQFRRCARCRRLNVEGQARASKRWQEAGRCCDCGAMLPEGEGMVRCSCCMERERLLRLIARAVRG